MRMSGILQSFNLTILHLGGSSPSQESQAGLMILQDQVKAKVMGPTPEPTCAVDQGTMFNFYCVRCQMLSGCELYLYAK